MPSRRAPAVPAGPAAGVRALHLARNVLALGEALAMVAAASVAIRWLPFRQVMQSAAWRGPPPRAGDAGATARRVRWAVGRWAKIVPWRVVCFQRGLAVHWMLRRRGIDSFLHYGIDGRAAGGISAHVWVELDGVALVGGEDVVRHHRVLVRPDPAAGA